jgi:LAO/AO transport system kinase
VPTVASQGQGIDDLLAALDRHRAAGEQTGEWQRRRLRRARAEVEALALAMVRATFTLGGADGVEALAQAVRDGQLDPYSAADRVVADR